MEKQNQDTKAQEQQQKQTTNGNAENNNEQQQSKENKEPQKKVEGMMDVVEDKTDNIDTKENKVDKDEDGGFDETKLIFGENTNISDENKKNFISLCKENKLSIDVANKLIDYQNKVNANYEAQRVSAINNWKVLAQKKYGTDFQAKLKAGRKALDTYGSKELIEILGDKSTGLGNHPAVVDFLVKVGESLLNDKFVRGNSSNVSLENRTESQKAKSLYPDM